MEIKHGGCSKCGTKDAPVLFSRECKASYCPACFEAVNSGNANAKIHDKTD